MAVEGLAVLELDQLGEERSGKEGDVDIYMVERCWMGARRK